MSKTNATIEISYEDGKRYIIKRDMITAVSGDATSTQIYFHGNVVEVFKPLDEILAVFEKNEMNFMTE
jgi:effector-binding domain-containing protein